MKTVFALFSFLVAATLGLVALGFLNDLTWLNELASALFFLGTMGLSTALGVTLLRDRK